MLIFSAAMFAAALNMKVKKKPISKQSIVIIIIVLFLKASAMAAKQAAFTMGGILPRYKFTFSK